MRTITAVEKKKVDSEIKDYQRNVNFDTKEFTVEVLRSKFNSEDKEIFIPDYQREYVWHEKRKSKFIESVVLGLPIPFMFFAEQEDGRLEIVDGCQRINTINSFMENDFELFGLRKLKSLNGFRFKDLPSVQQRKFKNRTLRVISLNESTSLDVRLDIFERINTGSDSLKGAETRRGSSKGLMSDLVAECVKLDKFKELCPLSDKRLKRHEDQELVLRFFAYSDRYQDFAHAVKEFLDDYLKEMNNVENFNIATKEMYKQHFISVLDYAEKVLPYGFARSAGSRMVPRVRFEALAVGISLALKEDKDIDIVDVDWLKGIKFTKLTTSDASNSPRKLRGRIEFVKNKLV